MSADFRIVVLISGRGTNLKSLIDGAQHYGIVRVISNKEDAPGLAVATQAGIPNTAYPRSRFSSLDAQKEAILDGTVHESPDLVVLAGFMQIIPPEFITAFPRRIINIHPALLPKFVGLDTHARALAAKETEHGCTVHLVDIGVDTGEILAQARLPIVPGDDAASLGARVLEHEHALYPWVVNTIARGDINLNPTPAIFSSAAEQQGRARGFTLGAGR